MNYDGDSPAHGETADRRAGQVERAIEELDEALLMLGHLVEEASGRLSPALRPEESRPAMSDREAKLAAVDTMRTSPLADRILAARSRVRALVGSLGELLERVDL